MRAELTGVLSVIRRLGFGVLACVLLIPITPARAQAQNCPGLERFSEMAGYATHLLSDPIDRYSPQNMRKLIRLISASERKFLRRALDTRFRSLEYPVVMSTVAELANLAEIGLAYDQSEFQRYADTQGLAARTETMQRIVRELCGAAKAGPRVATQTNDSNSTAALVTRALGRKKAETSQTVFRSHSTLVWIYILLTALVAALLLVPFVLSRVYALLLRRARCRIPSRLTARSREFRGQVVRMSLRGLDFEILPRDLHEWEKAAEQGNAVVLSIQDRMIRVMVSYMPEPDSTIIGMRIVRELEPEELRDFLKHSTIPPIRDGRQRRAQSTA